MSLDILLDQAESAFLVRHFIQSFASCVYILQRIMGYDDRVENDLTFSDLVIRLRLPSSGLIDHFCQNKCVCRACVLLAIQILYESKEYELIQVLVNKIYPILRLCPFDVFVAWIHVGLKMGKYQVVLDDLVTYIQREPSEDLLRQLSEIQREYLITILVQDCMLSLEQFEDAIAAIEYYSPFLQLESKKSLLALVSARHNSSMVASRQKCAPKVSAQVVTVNSELDNPHRSSIKPQESLFSLSSLNYTFLIHYTKVFGAAAIIFLLLYRVYLWIRDHPLAEPLRSQLLMVWKLAFTHSFGRHA